MMRMPSIATRLSWIAAVVAVLAALPCVAQEQGEEQEDISISKQIETAPPADVPIRAITRGPKFHWFGYYDKFQFDPTDRYVLGMEVDFEHRSPTPDDSIRIGMIDLEDGDRWIELGESKAFCWQQGCMLQWRPGSEDEILWNDRENGKFVCRILNVKTRQMRTIPRPVYNVSLDGKTGLGLDFARVCKTRPGYGYCGVDEPSISHPAPDRSTIYRIDLDSGEATDLFSLADVVKIPYPKQDERDRHWFNHIQWSPDGKRFLFLNRWTPRGRGGHQTRMLTAAADGTDIRLVNYGSSHYQWRDATHISIWVGGAYRLFVDDGKAGPGELMWKTSNGHQTYLPGLEWLITDTYPLGQDRLQIDYLMHLPTKRPVVLGRFVSPKQYGGEWRCDTHPRISRDGTKIVIDSPHGGDGRQMYLIDVSSIVGKSATP